MKIDYVLLGGIALAGGGLMLDPKVAETFATAPLLTSQCAIKGNISIETGERIYHVPGQRDYQMTRIRSEHGERWFCDEAEARAAGWRRALR